MSVKPYKRIFKEVANLTFEEHLKNYQQTLKDGSLKLEIEPHAEASGLLKFTRIYSTKDPLKGINGNDYTFDEISGKDTYQVKIKGLRRINKTPDIWKGSKGELITISKK